MESPLTLETIEIDTGTQDLLAYKRGRVLVLTMNRPAARNALSLDMLEAMSTQLTRAECDSDVGCVMLTGAEGAFCAGGDVKAMSVPGVEHASPAWITRQQQLQRSTSGMLFEIPKPTIAAVNGPAAGAGFGLATACDLRTMSTATFLITSFAKVALSGDFGGSFFLSQIVGTAKARELYFLSDRIAAEEALRIGLANRLYAPDALFESTLALAERLASGPSVALGFMKGNLNRALIAPANECLDVEASFHIACTMTADHREAATAFAEKRDPVFRQR